LAFLAYSNSFGALFLMDNREIILNDSRVHAATADHILRILNGPYWEVKLAGLYRPLVNLSYLLNYAVLGNGATPFGYHLMNFLIHAVNIGLVYALGVLIFDALPPACLLAALWGIHPVLTESVTNLVGRADLLAALGVLAALLAYTRAIRAEGRRQTAWFAAVALASAIGMFSKESAIVAIAVLFLYDVSVGQVPRPARDPQVAPGPARRARLPGYLAVAAPALVFLALRARVLAAQPYSPTPFADNPLAGAAFWPARLTALKVIGYQLSLLLWPRHLSSDYSYNQIPVFGAGNSAEDLKALLALVICLAAGAFALWVRRRDPRLFFGIGLFFIALAPTSNLLFPMGSIMAERFLYLPSAGLVICAACGFEAVWRVPRYRSAAAAVATVLLVAATLRTWNRNLDWSDERRFWRSASEAAPGSFKPRIMLASMAPLDGPAAWDSAAGDAAAALAVLDPLPDLRNLGSPWRDAGVVYRNIGDRSAAAHADASPWYRKSLAALQRSETIELAHEAVYRSDNAGRPGGVPTRLPAALYLELGRTWQRLSEPARAIAAYERGRALESDPDLLEELAAAHRQAGNPRAAGAALVEALAMDGSRTRLAGTLVELYGAADPFGCAIARTEAGPELNINCPVVHADLCEASRNVAHNYLRHGQPAEAAAIRRTAAADFGCTDPED
jgi:tetratricopeptide (TPR) repeat protein